MAVPAAVLANYVDNTYSPTPMWQSALVFVGPMLLAVAYALSPTWPRRRRVVLGSVGAALVVAGEAMVANDAGSCIDDDCLGLPALVVLTYLMPWVAGGSADPTADTAAGRSPTSELREPTGGRAGRNLRTSTEVADVRSPPHPTARSAPGHRCAGGSRPRPECRRPHPPL